MTITCIYLRFDETNTGEVTAEGQRAAADLVITNAGFVINEDGTIGGNEGDFGKFAGDEAPYSGKKFIEPVNPEDPWLLSDGILVLFSLQGEVNIPAFDSYIDPSPIELF